ncbi:hypothetical protein [Streptomyces zaomyceticus]|uniref:hypothetical protein n=1 Tax=Streptomyces zaomyceticus TaxID=68286 RepID=UPI003417135F
MSSRIILLGATGYTGDLILKALIRKGVRPTVAGRNPTALEALARRSGGLDHLTVDAATPSRARWWCRLYRARTNPTSPLESM